MPKPATTIRILCVCMGNICRSPTAEGVLRALAAQTGLADRLEIDSAGTHDYHIGRAPDQRTQQMAAQHGYDLSNLRARQVQAADFEHFDLILAMDRDNLRHLTQACPSAFRHKLKLFLDYAPTCTIDEVPDPYYGDTDGFAQVLALCETAARGLLKEVSPTSS